MDMLAPALPDGAHGDMFISFRAPTLKRDGVLRIGIETTVTRGRRMRARSINLATSSEGGPWTELLDEIRNDFETKLKAAKTEEEQRGVFKKLTGPALTLDPQRRGEREPQS